MRRGITKIQKIADAIAQLHRQGRLTQTDEEIATTAKLEVATVQEVLDQTITLVWGKLPLGMTCTRVRAAADLPAGVVVHIRGEGSKRL